MNRNLWILVIVCVVGIAVEFWIIDWLDKRRDRNALNRWAKGQKK